MEVRLGKEGGNSNVCVGCTSGARGSTVLEKLESRLDIKRESDERNLFASYKGDYKT